jgi:hypothetical protein
MFLFNSEKVVRAHSLGMEFCARRSKKMLGQLGLKLNGEARNKKNLFKKLKMSYLSRKTYMLPLLYIGFAYL